MVERESIVTGIFVLLALGLFVLSQGPWVSLSDLQIIALVIVIGVVAPLAINQYLNRASEH